MAKHHRNGPTASALPVAPPLAVSAAREIEPDPSLYINRELSWLAFNDRVVEEAQDTSNPLLERLRFLAISASNLDEFFEVRVAGLQAQLYDNLEPQDTPPDGIGDRLRSSWKSRSERTTSSNASTTFGRKRFGPNFCATASKCAGLEDSPRRTMRLWTTITPGRFIRFDSARGRPRASVSALAQQEPQPDAAGIETVCAESAATALRGFAGSRRIEPAGQTPGHEGRPTAVHSFGRRDRASARLAFWRVSRGKVGRVPRDTQ